MNIQWTLALRYLNGRKLRSFLTTLAVVFGVTVIFGMNILIPSMVQSFQATMLAASNSVDLTISNKANEAFSTAVLDQVRGVNGVRAAQGILSRAINLPADYFDHNPKTADRVSIVSLVGINPEDASQMHGYALQGGRFLQSGDTASCVISQSLADNLNLKVGDALPLPTTKGQVELTIAGILPPRTIPGNEEVLVPLPEAQQLLDASGKINVIETNYSVTDSTQRAQVQNAIEARLGDSFQFGTLSSGSDLLGAIQLAETIFNVFGLLALFMGGFIIFNTFRTLVTERRRDLGMLRAVGANRRTIIGLILTEGFLQGTVGSLIGMALGYGFGALALYATSPLLESFVHVKLDKLVLQPSLIVITLVLGIGVTLVSGLIPALSAGRVTPIEALRPSLGKVEHRKAMTVGAIIGIILIGIAIAGILTGNIAFISLGAVLFMAGLILLAPALVRPIALGFGALLQRTLAREGTGELAQGNLTRQPGRAAITASTSMIALAILVAVGGLTTTLKFGFVDVMHKSLGSDYLFVPPAIAVWGNNVGADSSFVQQLKGVNGVGPVSTFRFAMTNADLKPAMPSKMSTQAAGAGGISVSLLGIDPVAFPDVAGMRFEKGDADTAYKAIANGREMIVNGIFASTAGLKVGDMVPLITPTGKQLYRVAAVASDYLNIKVITAYISQANLAADFGKTEDVFIQLDLKPGANRAQVESQLKAIKQQYPQFTMISGQAYNQQMTQMFNAAFAGMYVLFIFLTIPSLIGMLNTLAISVLERTREIGMLRAVGSTQKQVKRMILAESLLLAFAGTIFGLLAGTYLSYLMIGAMHFAGFPIDFYFPWAGLVYATFVGLLFGALAAIIPSRQAARLQIVEALHYE